MTVKSGSEINVYDLWNSTVSIKTRDATFHRGIVAEYWNQLSKVITQSANDVTNQEEVIY